MQTKKTDQYFLESANNVSFFFEEDAFAEDGSLRQAKALSINKIGHGEPSITSLATDVENSSDDVSDCIR